MKTVNGELVASNLFGSFGLELSSAIPVEQCMEFTAKSYSPANVPVESGREIRSLSINANSLSTESLACECHFGLDDVHLGFGHTFANPCAFGSLMRDKVRHHFKRSQVDFTYAFDIGRFRRGGSGCQRPLGNGRSLQQVLSFFPIESRHHFAQFLRRRRRQEPNLLELESVAFTFACDFNSISKLIASRNRQCCKLAPLLQCGTDNPAIVQTDRHSCDRYNERPAHALMRNHDEVPHQNAIGRYCNVW